MRCAKPRTHEPHRLRRVGSSGQDLAIQHAALTTARCDRICSETASGTLREQPKLDRMLLC
jgi:hypothetical protein